MADSTGDGEESIDDSGAWRRTTTIQNFLGRLDFVDFQADTLSISEPTTTPDDSSVLRSIIDVFAGASARGRAPVRHGFFLHNYVENTGSQSSAIVHSLTAASDEAMSSWQRQHGVIERRSGLTVSTQLRKARGVLDKVARELHVCLEESRAAEAAFEKETANREPHAQRLEDIRRLCQLLKTQAAALDAFHARKLSHAADLHRILQSLDIDSRDVEEMPSTIAHTLPTTSSQRRRSFLRHCGIAPMTDAVSPESLLLLSVHPWVRRELKCAALFTNHIICSLSNLTTSPLCHTGTRAFRVFSVRNVSGQDLSLPSTELAV